MKIDVFVANETQKRINAMVFAPPEKGKGILILNEDDYDEIYGKALTQVITTSEITVMKNE